MSKYDFTINLEQIKIVNNYTYLGVNFSANGSFTNHKETLKEKTRRFFFVTRRYLDFLRLPITTINRHFNSLFSSILTYCSEVWGVYDKSDYNSWEKDPIEKTHIHFCKTCLGVNKRAPNVASRNDLGRSLKLQISMNILKFWIHLENQPTDSIAKQCLNISDKMANEEKTGLINKINLLCAQLNLDKNSIDFHNPTSFIFFLSSTLNILVISLFYQ